MGPFLVFMSALAACIVAKEENVIYPFKYWFFSRCLYFIFYRPVKIIRLVSKNTVEEIILKRAEQKLKLTNSVVEGGQVGFFVNKCLIGAD